MPSLQRAGVRFLHTGDLLQCLTGFDTIFQLHGLRFFLPEVIALSPNLS